MFHGRRLLYGDVITYTEANVAPQNPNAPAQPASGGPYMGVLVDFTETEIGVRADGWFGLQPLYNLSPQAILNVEPAKSVVPGIEGLAALSVPVPPQLEQAIGYPGGARFVAFYWTPYGDEAIYDDGLRSGTGEWNAYLTFVRHPSVAPALEGVNLGHSESEASHWLVLDRQTRRLFVAHDSIARRLLRQQWPKPEASTPVIMTPEELERHVLDALSIKSWKEIPTVVGQEEVVRQMQEHARVVQDMQAYLNQFIINPQIEDNGAGL